MTRAHGWAGVIWLGKEKGESKVSGFGGQKGMLYPVDLGKL